MEIRTEVHVETTAKPRAELNNRSNIDYSNHMFRTHRTKLFLFSCLIMMLVISQTGMYLHASSHDAQLPVSSCITCIAANELLSSCLDSEVQGFLVLTRALIEPAQEPQQRSVKLLIRHQRGPPVPS